MHRIAVQRRAGASGGRLRRQVLGDQQSRTASEPGEVTALTLATVAASILLHGISVTPLMDFYAKRSLRRGRLRRP